jgi:putative transposase
MANTYTQIHIHAVFAVKRRESLIQNNWEEELFKYITGIVHNNNHKMIAINGMPDHVHMLFGLRPAQSLSSLMQQVKGDSTLWINDKGFLGHKFSWQEGYGAFSYRKSDIGDVINYIKGQKDHHKTVSFRTEYENLLREFQIPFKDEYLFDFLEGN